MEEVAEALADSQIHANRELSRLRKPDAGDPDQGRAEGHNPR